MLARHDIESWNPSVERRARARSRSFKHAKILFNENKSIYDAVLKNVTAYGATLTVNLTEQLPEAFNLYLVNEDFTVPCQVRWRRSDSVGVAF